MDLIIIGLGNPGADYARTRHNCGFMVIDLLAARWRVEIKKSEGYALTGEAQWGGKKILLVKPQTYMNLSGKAVAALLDVYELNLEDMLVIYDDLDLPLGKIRLRPQGGHGGHRGLMSIIDTLGTNKFPRLRVGIGRPPAGVGVVDYVLSPFTEKEQAVMEETLARAAGIVETMISRGLVAAMNEANGDKGVVKWQN